MNNKLVRTMLLTFILVLLAIDLYLVAGQPVGADILFNESVNVTGASAGAITTAGGSFTTLVLNVTQQNPRWKAYVGNVSGDLRLKDNNDYTIYDWDLTIISGEVFASRSNDITWENIQCLTNSVLATEQVALNMTSSKVDSINSTFLTTNKHQQFWIGSTLITNSSCRSIATYVNNAAQANDENADFQEILLDDTSNLVYATIIEQDQPGYDSGKTFDFQMIIAEDEYAASPTTYYFYAEIG